MPREAVQFGTSPEVSEQTVTTVFRSGYSFGGKLLRAAVVVVTGPEHEAAEADSPEPDSAGPDSSEAGSPAADSPEAGASA